MQKDNRVYKIARRAEWEALKREGVFAGSPDDLRDGFIHLSAAGQVKATAAKYFTGQDELFLLAIDAATLGSGLKWEPSRGGARFPHLYGVLPLSAVEHVTLVSLGDGGRQAFPLVIP